jgi:predicted nucleic acid-binding Zn ribbon protein|tara:strand:- start:1040 stop:1315 length:276 start_codon:yes stop_codon:yes gene_type:complete
MEKLNTSIQSFLENYGLKKGVKQNSAVLFWEEVVGKKISENTNPQGVEHGTLTVSVSNPAWRQELLFKKKEIIKQLNEKIGENTIKEVRFI